MSQRKNTVIEISSEDEDADDEKEVKEAPVKVKIEKSAKVQPASKVRLLTLYRRSQLTPSSASAAKRRQRRP